MSIPAQGAVGAARVCHKEQMEVWTSEIAGDLSMGGWFREDISYDDKLAIRDTIAGNIRSIVGTAFDLATPRTDSDEGTAGADGRFVAQFVHRAMQAAVQAVDFEEGRRFPPLEDECGQWWHTAECIVSALKEAGGLPASASTPATPPGVPDSVREAFVALIQERAKWACDIWPKDETKFRELEMSLLAGLKRIASHPAGQSTAAEPDPTLTYWIESETERLCNLYPAAAAGIVEFREELVGLMEGNPAGQSAGSGAGMKLVPEQPTEAMLNAPLAPGSSITSARYESRRDLRPLIYAAMIGAAPDSTRTGQGGVPPGWALVPVVPTEDMIFADIGLRPDAHRYDAIASKAAHSYRLMIAAAPAPSGPPLPGMPDPADLASAVRGIADDYMTSDRHHPGYVLIPAEKFDRLRAASEALSDYPGGQSDKTGHSVRDDIKCRCVGYYGPNPECGACGGSGCVAARPAAPEAQGAWRFDMEAAPREYGRELLGWGRLRGSAPIRAIMTWFDAGGDFDGKSGWWTVASLHFEPIAFQPLPAPPSSGQGGR